MRAAMAAFSLVGGREALRAPPLPVLARHVLVAEAPFDVALVREQFLQWWNGL